MKSPVRAPVQSFAKRYDAVIERAVLDVIDEIGDRVLTSKQIEDLVRQVFAKHGVDAKLTKELMAGIVKSVGAGAGVSIGAAQGVAIQRWWMDKAYSPDDKKFSSKINDLSRKTEITGAIRGSMRARDSWRKAAQDLHDRGIQRADVAKDITELSKRARQAFAQSGDAKGYVEYMRDVRAVQKRIDRLTDPSTSRLKRAYQDVIDAAEKRSEEAMRKAIKYAAFEKERYNAERIARTEMAKAYGDSFITENVNDPDAVGWRAELSDAHTVTDICDFHTSADLYGMGAGVYPKGRGPAYPFHPHCTCVLSTVYEGDAPEVKRKKIDEKGGVKYLRSIPAEEAKAMLGVEGYAEFKKDPNKWQEYLSNWQGHEVKKATVPLDLLHGTK